MDNLLAWMPTAIGVAGLLSGLVLWALSRIFTRPRPHPDTGADRCTNTFILHDHTVFSHDVEGWAAEAPFSNWESLRAWFEPRFHGLPRSLGQIEPDQECFYPTQDKEDPACISIVALRNQSHRVTLFDPLPNSPALRHNISQQAADQETFRSAMSAAPLAMCCLDAEQQKIWQNAAFAAFSESEQNQLLASRSPEEGQRSNHITLAPSNGASPRHFEVTSIKEGALTFVFATDESKQVKSDTTRSTFIQTLTKTFADLSIGLAVFDTNRQLVLFNPALTDLTHLPIDFLSARPGLTDFFDRLRENQVLPEPKSYATWRAQISSIIDTTEDGHYCEAWCLPTGLTYRVTGRPHTDGSVAFLIEDISDEISLTRRYRTQLDMRQAVLNHISEAVSVISPSGVVVFSNDAFNSLLGSDPDDALAEMRATTLLETCRERFPKPGFWEKVQEMMEHRSRERKLHQTLPSGATCRIELLPGRFLFIGIKQSAPAHALSA